MAEKPGLPQEQSTAIKRLKARGFAVIDNTTMGITMGLVDADNFFQKVAVDRHGRIKRYMATKAKDIHRQKMPRLQEKLRVLPSGNLQ